MEIQFIKTLITRSLIEKWAKEGFGEMVKAVVDVKKEIIVASMELHADGEAFLLERGSSQQDLWGINLYPGKSDWIEFDSMINIRPSQNNRSRSVENPEIQKKIIQVVQKLIQ